MEFNNAELNIIENVLLTTYHNLSDFLLSHKGTLEALYASEQYEAIRDMLNRRFGHDL